MRPLILIAAVAIVSAGYSGSAVAAPISYTTVDFVYSQDFDTLASSPLSTQNNQQSIAWNDGTAPLPGWYASVSDAGSPPSRYLVSRGDFINRGEVFSYGSTDASDRALGTQSRSNTTERIGVAFVNDGNVAFLSFTVTYDGEQWRRVTNNGPDGFVVEYQFFDGGAGFLTAPTGWTVVPELQFNAPQINISNSVSLNGNSASNRVAGITATITDIRWNPGDELWIRFTDGATNAEHGVAIDNFQFVAHVPEPHSLLLGVGGLLGLLCLRRRK